MPPVEKIYRITAPENVHHRLNAFLAFMHYNGGHTGTFAMSFDGDGNESLKVDPPPPREFARKMHQRYDAGQAVEWANQDGNYYSIPEDRNKPYYVSNNKGLWKVSSRFEEDETWELVREG